MNSLQFTKEDELIADYDEEQIEAMPESMVRNSALRRLDDMQIEQIYESERERLKAVRIALWEELRKCHNKQTDAHQLPFLQNVSSDFKRLSKTVERVDKALKNLWAALESPDLNQRERFQHFYKTEGLAKKTIPHVIHILEVLEPAKRAPARVGRPRRPEGKIGPVSPALKKIDAPLLIKMKILCATGSTIHAAADAVLRERSSGFNASHAKRLEKVYREKMALRRVVFN